MVGDDVLEVHVHDAESLAAAAAALSAVGTDPRIDHATHRVSVSVDDGTRRLMEAVRALADAGVPVEDLSLRHPTLDEVFLSLTGKPAASTDTSAAGTGPRAA